MTTPGKAVVLTDGKRGVLSDGKAALFNASSDCNDCCCVPSDVLVITCNANRITDDDYTVTLNGHALGNVVHVGDWQTGCVSPGTGLWACTDSSITPANLTNINTAFAGCNGNGYNCTACAQDNAWTTGTLDSTWLLSGSNELILDGTSDEGCGDWGLVAVWSVDAARKRLCQMLLCGQYVGGGGNETLFDGTFNWTPPPSKLSPARGLGDSVERALDATGIGPVVKRAITGVTGKPCGCDKRRDALNRLVPYNPKS